MTSIGPAAAFAERLRTHLARAERNAGLRPPAASAATSTPTSSGASSPEVTLAARVGALDPSDPRRRERAFSLFIESLLVAEFGPRLAADPGLAVLVERVAAQMREDARLAPLVDDVVDRLLAAAG